MSMSGWLVCAKRPYEGVVRMSSAIVTPRYTWAMGMLIFYKKHRE